jgi:transposase-like protein
MDIRQQAIKEYLVDGMTYQQLSQKYGVSRSTINKWVLVYQEIHNLPRTAKQKTHDLQQMAINGITDNPIQDQTSLEQKVALLEKQLAWEKMKATALDKMIDIAEKELNIDIRKKPGTEQSMK